MAQGPMVSKVQWSIGLHLLNGGAIRMLLALLA